MCVCIYNDTIMSIRGYGLCRPIYVCVCVYTDTIMSVRGYGLCRPVCRCMHVCIMTL